MKRRGFTLIEIMIVVGIIAIILTTAVMSVASGRGAVKVKEATRGVMQMSRYASALSLLRQRPVVVTYHKKGKIEVRISGESSGGGDIGTPSDPIYREVNGEVTLTAEEIAAEEDGGEPLTEKKTADGTTSSSSAKTEEKKGLFYTRQVLDPETLRKEDAEGEYEGVTFAVEVLGEDGEVLPPELAAMRTLKRPERIKKIDDGELESEIDDELDVPVSVTYEPNGSVNPYRIIVRHSGEDESDEGFAIEISRSGKAAVGDVENETKKPRRRR